MTKAAFTIFLIAVLAFLVFAQRNDEKNQCDGKTKIYASMGKSFPCNNYKDTTE